MKVIYSRDIIFDENTVSGIQKESESVNKYVELEVEEEGDTQKETESDIEVKTGTENIPTPSDTLPVEEQSEEPQTVTPHPPELICGDPCKASKSPTGTATT